MALLAVLNDTSSLDFDFFSINAASYIERSKNVERRLKFDTVARRPC